MSSEPRDAAPGPAADHPPAGFVLGPATRVLWRAPDSVGLELGSDGVVLDGVGPPLIAALRTGGVPGDSDPQTVRVLGELRRRGYLWRHPGATDDPDAPDDRCTPPAPRLGPELVALSARQGERAAELLDARRHAAIVVSGTGRAGPHLAALLAASGVGRVHCPGAGSARLHHALPGGVTPADEGRSFAGAAAAAVVRAAPEADPQPPPAGELPDLVVLAVDEPVDENRRAALHADRVPHLLVSLGPTSGTIGPLVVPGLTSCLRCADLHRRDRDPRWPALAAQLSVAPRYGPASDAALATSLVGAAAHQVLTFLDGGDPATVEGSLELHLPDWRLRRRTRPLHHDCDCCAVSADSPVDRAETGAADSSREGWAQWRGE